MITSIIKLICPFETSSIYLKSAAVLESFSITFVASGCDGNGQNENTVIGARLHDQSPERVLLLQSVL